MGVGLVIFLKHDRAQTNVKAGRWLDFISVSVHEANGVGGAHYFH